MPTVALLVMVVSELRMRGVEMVVLPVVTLLVTVD